MKSAAFADKNSDTQCSYMLHRANSRSGGAHRFEYETEALIIASRKGYRIESSPNHHLPTKSARSILGATRSLSNCAAL
jgi:hypothetical protein